MPRNKQVVKFPFRFAGQYASITCIYKLSFNDHFFIAGTKALHKRAYVHSEEIERKLRLGWKANDHYKNIIPFIQANDVKEFVVEVLFEVANESDLPAAEQRMFDIVKDNPKCLNAGFEAQERAHLQPKKDDREKEDLPAPEPEASQPGNVPFSIEDQGRVINGYVETGTPGKHKVVVTEMLPAAAPEPVTVTMEQTEIGNTTFHSMPRSREDIVAPAMVPKVKSDSPLSFKERMALINKKYAAHNA